MAAMHGGAAGLHNAAIGRELVGLATTASHFSLLQGRDAEAASGFLDEISLLNSLAGHSNIIQLIDSEVSTACGCEGDWEGPREAGWQPALLTLYHPIMYCTAAVLQVHRSEGLIYMVLEFGDIDLAHLLQVGWVRCSGCLLRGGCCIAAGVPAGVQLSASRQLC